MSLYGQVKGLVIDRSLEFYALKQREDRIYEYGYRAARTCNEQEDEEVQSENRVGGSLRKRDRNYESWKVNLLGKCSGAFVESLVIS